MHPGHEIVICSNCGSIVRQCRCFEHDKPVRNVPSCNHCPNHVAQKPVFKLATATK